MPFDPFADDADDADDVDNRVDGGAPVPSAEERAAAERRAVIEAGRRKGGVAGAVLAGSMLALRDIYEGPPKDQLPVEIEASGEPHDLERDGVRLDVEGVGVSTPPLERRDPLPAPRRRR